MTKSTPSPLRARGSLLVLWLLIGIAASGQSIRLDYGLINGAVHYHLENTVDCPVYVRLAPRDSVSRQLDYRSHFTLSPHERAESFIVLPFSSPVDTANAAARAFDHFNFTIHLGDPNAQPDKKHRYQLPFKKGKAYRLIQGFNGSFSHNTDNARYALDFDLAVGDTIYAARGGVAVKVEENFTAGGAEDKYRDKDNHILIYHSDGTLGAYAHLDHQGALVAPGDRVEAGQPIGISGFTGYASVPHLHFVVRQTTRDG